MASIAVCQIVIGNKLTIPYGWEHGAELTEPLDQINATFKRKDRIVKYYFGKTKRDESDPGKQT